MSYNDDGGPAFPMPAGPEPRVHENHHYNEGMSLRDYFAAKAMQSILVVLREGMRDDDVPKMASDCYAIADAMLKVRKA